MKSLNEIEHWHTVKIRLICGTIFHGRIVGTGLDFIELFTKRDETVYIQKDKVSFVQNLSRKNTTKTRQKDKTGVMND